MESKDTRGIIPENSNKHEKNYFDDSVTINNRSGNNNINNKSKDDKTNSRKNIDETSKSDCFSKNISLINFFFQTEFF